MRCNPRPEFNSHRVPKDHVMLTLGKQLYHRLGGLLLLKLDNNKATGLDGISVRALKAGSPILSVISDTHF